MEVAELSQEDIEEVAKKTDWNFELKKDEWLFNEALMLSIGIGDGNEPHRFSGLYFKQTDPRNPILRAEFEKRKKLLASTQFSNKIPYFVSSIKQSPNNTMTRSHFEPLVFIKWCIEKELKIPQQMREFYDVKSVEKNRITPTALVVPEPLKPKVKKIHKGAIKYSSNREKILLVALFFVANDPSCRSQNGDVVLARVAKKIEEHYQKFYPDETAPPISSKEMEKNFSNAINCQNALKDNLRVSPLKRK